MKIEIMPQTMVPQLLEWRREVIETVFGVKPSEELMLRNRDYYASHVPIKSHIAVVASVDGEEAGCGGVCFQNELPSPDNETGLDAYLMNIYVRPKFRRMGVGEAIVKWLVEASRERGCGKIYLETTEKGESLYKRIGFDEMPDMMKI